VNRVYIFGGGSIDTDFVSSYMEAQTDGDRTIIAADGGLNVLHRMGIRPDVILGDFDSVHQEWLSLYAADSRIRLERFPTHKDYTDMELAVELGLELAADELVLFGATGTRLDHVIGNVFALQKPMERGIPAKLVDSNNVIQLLGPGNYEVCRTALFGKYVSFLPYTERASGITLTGFLYPLDEAEMVRGTTLGISNELAEERGVVSVQKGILIFIQSRD
jgi:thiamine pyrophosphokinase